MYHRNLNLNNSLYLNANILFSECLQRYRLKESGTLRKLKIKGFDLVCSTFGKSEVLKKLKQEKSIPLSKSRTIFENVRNDYHITLISNIQDIVIINDVFFDKYCVCTLDLADLIHITIAKSLGIKLCTHDLKMYSTQHDAKKRIYDLIFKPEELIN